MTRLYTGSNSYNQDFNLKMTSNNETTIYINHSETEYRDRTIKNREELDNGHDQVKNERRYKDGMSGE